MANYDLSKPAPDRSRRVHFDSGSGVGGLGFMLAGLTILLVVLFAVFGGAAIPTDSTPAPASPVVDPAPVPPVD